MRNLATIGWAALAILLLPLAGRAGDGIVALQTADPSCADGSSAIYVDCGNGTVTDNRTGLVWLANANCFGELNWRDAMRFIGGLADLPNTSVASADDCGLSDGSSSGEWRLPSMAEWEAMIADAVALGCVSGMLGGPSITNDSGADCWQEGPGNSFSGVVSSSYWSSTTDVKDPRDARDMALFDGEVGLIPKTGSDYVWPVRGGQ